MSTTTRKPTRGLRAFAAMAVIATVGSAAAAPPTEARLATGGASLDSAARAAAAGAEGKIAQDLRAVRDAAMAQDGDARAAMANRHAAAYGRPSFLLRGDAAEQIQVYVSVEDPGSETLAALEQAGLEVELVSAKRHLVQGWVKLDGLRKLAELDAVRSIRRPSYGVPTSGEVRSQGDLFQGTNIVRSLENFNGSGVRVGVISQGLFESQPLDADTNVLVDTGEIPGYEETFGSQPPVNRFFGAVEIFPGSFSAHVLDQEATYGLPQTAYPEGAAMLEVLFDVAPGVRAFFGGARTDLELEAARRELANRGIDILIENLVFPDAGRFDGSSTVSQTLEAIASGRQWFDGQRIRQDRPKAVFASAGGVTPPVANSVDSLTSLPATRPGRFPAYVVDYFRPSTATSGLKLHNFATEGSPEDQLLLIRPDATSGQVELLIIWDDVWDDAAPRATRDLDLYLTSAPGYSLDLPAAQSTAFQNGFGLPIERIFYAPTVPGTFLGGLAIRKKDQNDNSPLLFTVLILQGSIIDTNHLTHGIALNNADALPPVISVGEVAAFANGTSVPDDAMPGLDPGPGQADRNGYVKWFTAQDVPTVVGYTRVSTATTNLLGTALDPFYFEGPSAATAHLGAAAALIRHRYPDISLRDYRALFSDTNVNPSTGDANATLIQEATVSGFGNRPFFRRTNPLFLYQNLQTGSSSTFLSGRTAALATASYDIGTSWRQGVTDVHESPLFNVTAHGLALSPGGKENVFGYWESDLVPFVDGDGAFSTELRADRVYEIEAVIASDEADPLKVPDFRLRAMSGTGEEASVAVFAGLDANSNQMPTDLSGKVYRFYYRPSNDEVARQGMRVAFDLTGFSETDNRSATLYLRSVNMRELVPTTLMP